MKSTTSLWTEAEIKIVRQGMADKLVPWQIAEQIRKSPDRNKSIVRTANSVCGKIWRLGGSVAGTSERAPGGAWTKGLPMPHWTPGQDALLIELVKTNMSIDDISASFNPRKTHGGVKNRIGRLRTQGLIPPKEKPARTPRAPKPAKPSAPALTAVESPEIAAVVIIEQHDPATIDGVLFLDLTDNCCKFWLHGDGIEAKFCGRPVQKRPWCPEHTKRCTTPIKSWRLR